MANEKAWYILWPLVRSGEPQEPYPLPCLNLITLITYLFSFLLFVCLTCPWPLGKPQLTYPSRHHLTAYCAGVGVGVVRDLGIGYFTVPS